MAARIRCPHTWRRLGSRSGRYTLTLGRGSAMPETRPVVGIDLGGTNIQIGVFSRDFKVLARARRKSKADEGRDRVIDRIVDGVAEASAEAKVSVTDLAGVGIGAPGAIDPATGTVL